MKEVIDMATAIVEQQDPYAVKDAIAFATQQSALQTLLDTYNMNLLTGQANMLTTNRAWDTGLGSLASLVAKRGMRESGQGQRQFSKYGQDWLKASNDLVQGMTNLGSTYQTNVGATNATYNTSVAQNAIDKQNDILKTANTIKTNT